MTGISPEHVTSETIARFFTDRKIDAFCIADVSAIRAPAGRHPRDILPACRTIILFGIVMPDRFFSGTLEEQAAETRNLKVSLESAAIALKGLLVRAGAAAEAILPSLPLVVEEGKLRGLLSLKHCAADAGFGTIGENTLLIHPEYGNRLALAAVITEKEISPTRVPVSMPECTRCNKCMTACPTGAIREGEVEQIACQNITDYVPRSLRPLVWRLMRGRLSAQVVTPVLSFVGPHVEIRATCTACVTACPYFNKGKR
jgi:epoxyqueuosine reductase QueG